MTKTKRKQACEARKRRYLESLTPEKLAKIREADARGHARARARARAEETAEDAEARRARETSRRRHRRVKSLRQQEIAKKRAARQSEDAPVHSSDTMLTRERSERQAARDANMKLARIRHENVELFMECDEEELSPAQIAAHKKAVGEYQEALKKIAAVKAAQATTTVVSNNVSAGTEMSNSAPQAQLLIQQQPSEPLIGIPRVAFPANQPQQPQYIIQNTMPVTSIQTPTAGYKLLFDTRTGLILGTMPNESPAVIATTGANQQPVVGNQNPLSVDRMHVLYGQPRRTSNKLHAAKLFEDGKDMRGIAKSMHVSENTAELYLIDSVYLGQEVNYVRLSNMLSIKGAMLDAVLDLLTTHANVTLSELQAQTGYSYNQIRLCVARLFRGLFWQIEEEYYEEFPH